MKILFFLGLAIPLPGAAWTRIAFFAEYFKNRGHEVCVAGIFSPRSIRKVGLLYWRNVKIYNVCPAMELGGIVSFIFNVITPILTLPLLQLSLRSDLSIISVPPYELAIGAYLASKFTGAKIAFDVRDEWDEYIVSKEASRLYRRAYLFFSHLMGKVFSKSDLVVSVTSGVADSLRRRNIPNVKVVPNGADIEIFQPQSKSKLRSKFRLDTEDFVIVYDGYVGSYYRLDVVVKALAKLKKEQRIKTKLIVVGGGKGMRTVINVTKSLGLSNILVYFGVKTNKRELVEVLAMADVGVIPYDDNPLWKSAIPAKFYEYCACGLPVIATV